MILVGLYKSFALLNQNYDIIQERDAGSTGEQLQQQQQHEASINCIVGLKDFETVITCSNDPKLVVWNLFNNEIMIR